MKHILILSGLMAATAFARDAAAAPRAPFIARQPLSAASVANPAFNAQLPAVSPALSDPSVHDAFVKMTTVEDGMATLENRLRLLGSAMDALSDTNKRTHQFGVVAEKYARVFVKISTWSSDVFVTRKPLVVVK
ncbi:MAG: hypothetical protein JWO82_620 [Akkermansiaceae bacterium]|nr:hypothetical protein [Akkermansiaceae bacterium]